MNTYRRLAKTIACTKTAGELAKIVAAELDFNNQYLCHILRKTMKEWAGDNNLRVVGPKHFGAENFRQIFVDNKLPCLKNVLKIADKLNLQLVLKNYPFSQSFAVPRRDYAFDAEIEHAELAAFLLDLSTHRSARGDSPEMRKERERILENLSNPEFPLYWTTLIRYAAACGYQANFYLNQKQEPEPARKIDGCLTPSKVQHEKTAAARVDCKCGNDDDDALLSRLNYPM